MNIDIFGKSGRLSRKEARYAADFFAKALLGPRLVKNIDLILSFEREEKSMDGFCFPIDGNKSKKPRSFEIAINPYKGRLHQLKVLAHEMVHLKQYARGELFSESVNIAEWKGQKWKLDKGTIVNYFFFPWEIEAYGLEKGLSLLYNIHLIQEKKKF